MEEEKSYQEIRKELIDKYKTVIEPKLLYYNNDFEKACKTRKFLKIMSLAYIFLPLILGFLFALFIPKNYSFLIRPAFTIFAITFMLFIGAKRQKIKQIKRHIKEIIMPIICDCFDNLKWIPDKVHSTEQYNQVCLIPYSKSYRFVYDDCFRGMYKNIIFTVEELALKGNKNATIFKGVALQFIINKKFNGHTVIYPNSITHTPPSLNLHHTELEDVIFEKQYDVYTNDDVEARYLITPSFMKRLNEIQEKFYANEIYAAFKNGVFYLALGSSKDLFEITDFEKQKIDMSQYYIFVGEIISILKLIDYFKLDQNIGM